MQVGDTVSLLAQSGTIVEIRRGGKRIDMAERSKDAVRVRILNDFAIVFAESLKPETSY